MIFYFEKSKKFSITIFYCNFGERHLSYGKFTIMVNVVSDKVIYPSLCILYLGRLVIVWIRNRFATSVHSLFTRKLAELGC